MWGKVDGNVMVWYKDVFLSALLLAPGDVSNIIVFEAVLLHGITFFCGISHLFHQY